MSSESKETKKAAKVLHRMQGKQLARAEEIGNRGGRLEKRSRQLQTLEARMAQLERQAFGPGPDGKPVAAGPKALRPARLIINPGSASFAKMAGSPEELVARLRTYGIQAEVYLKTSTKAIHGWVSEAVKNNEGLVIAVGGDGTIEDVAGGTVGRGTAVGIPITGTH